MRRKKIPSVAQDKLGGLGAKCLQVLEGKAAMLVTEPTCGCKWDICAGDAIMRTLGGALVQTDEHRGKEHLLVDSGNRAVFVVLWDGGGAFLSIFCRQVDLSVRAVLLEKGTGPKVGQKGI